MDADAWDERYRADRLLWGAEPNQFVRELCERLPVGRALDLACGEGRNALWLARLGWQVTAIDHSPVAIARARALGAREPAAAGGRITWVVADVTSTLPRPSSVDLTVISYLHLAPAQRDTVVRSGARAVRLAVTSSSSATTGATCSKAWEVRKMPPCSTIRPS
ncbi:MAG: class I SAM-dependent methyltransferase [Nocardioidaceae bacterium]